MTKVEIFKKILETCAEVCDVSSEDIMSGVRAENVVVARTICVFWCMSAGFSVESMLKCTDRTNANSINSITARVEDLWVNKFAFHILMKEVGKRLLDYAHSIGEDFDIVKPLNTIAKATDKYRVMNL